MRCLFLFVDGMGLGEANPVFNPLAAAQMPNLDSLLGGGRLLEGFPPRESKRASLLALDACLGVPGLPQSATGQSTLISGQNVPALIGRHYGPKPNPEIAEILRNGNLFNVLRNAGLRVGLLNAYPQRYFDAVSSGRRLYSAIPFATTEADIPLKTAADLFAGRALSADFTGRGWREHLDYPETPLLSPRQAGARLVELAAQYDFSLFEFWLSDYVGHRQEMDTAVAVLEDLDKVLGGLAENWDDQAGLILVTSDHGNLEDLRTRRHTTNPVPAVLIGDIGMRRNFADGLLDLTGITPAILRLFGLSLQYSA